MLYNTFEQLDNQKKERMHECMNEWMKNNNPSFASYVLEFNSNY